MQENAQPTNRELENGQSVTIQLGTYKVAFAFTSYFGVHYIDIYNQQAVCIIVVHLSHYIQ